MQLRDLRAYAKARGWKIAGEYVDQAQSGSKRSRPELDRLMAAARARSIDCIVCWKLDRWGRTMHHCLESIQEINSLGLRWIATTQGLDTHESNPMSRAMLGMMAVFAEFEREMIRERVRAGLKNAIAKGTHCGRPAKMFDKRKAADLRKAGVSVREMAKKLRVSKGTVQRFLAR
jgi:DNA invertase Pin-like site-specific DNA recombinase